MDHPTTTTGKKKRPRTVLLSLFPKGVVTPQEVSDALRKSGGNLEEAKKLLDNQLINSKPAAIVKDDRGMAGNSNTGDNTQVAENDMVDDKKQSADNNNTVNKKQAADHNDIINNNNDNKINRPEEPGDCAICFCQYTSTDGIVLQGCNHAFCLECISIYIRGKAKDGEVTPSHMKCPSIDPEVCSKPITQSDVLTCLESEVDRDRYLRLTLDRCIDNDENMGCCPTAGCKFLFAWDPENRKLDCPFCKKTYCLVCRIGPWHTGIRCKQYQHDQKAKGKSEGGDETDEEFRKFASKQKLKQCPRCRFWVEKDHGCDAMHCRCNLVFCYKCGGCLKNTAKKGGYKECTCRGSQDILQSHESSGMNHNLMPPMGMRMPPSLGMGMPPLGGMGRGFPGLGFADPFPGGGNRLGGGDGVDNIDGRKRPRNGGR